MAEKKIAGTTYRINKLPARKSLLMITKITKLVGPGLPDLVKAFGEREEDAAQSNISFAAGLAQIVAEAEESTFEEFADVLLERAEMLEGGQYLPITLDHFNDREDEALELMAAVFQECFGRFFTGLLANGGAAKAKA